MQYLYSSFKKHIVLFLLFFSASCITIATFLYPGGSILNQYSVGFDWTTNFFSNLFKAKAINGKANPGQLWAIVGMAFHSIGYGIFFIRMSYKMDNQHAALVLKVVGFADIIFNFLIATPLHDSMVSISSTLSLLGIFYIIVFIIKTKLQLLKLFCITCMLIFYYTLFLYGTGDWRLLAIMQKIALGCSVLLVLSLDYFTRKADFRIGEKTN